MKGRSISLSGLFAIVAAAMTVSPAQSYEVGTVTGGGTIEGTIYYRGTVPMKKILPTKDTEVCGAPREDPMIRVGADQAVESAVVYLVEVATGKAWPELGKPPALDNVKCRFEPEVQVIPAGPLDVVNSDPVLHNTHGYYGKRTAFNLALPNEGQTHPDRTAARRRGPRRLRRARLDGRLDLRRGQSLLRGDRRRRQILHHRRPARRLHARGGATLYRPDGNARNRNGRPVRRAWRSS